MGPNHIDARLGAQCHYGVLDPLFRAPGPRGLRPLIRGSGPLAQTPSHRSSNEESQGSRALGARDPCDSSLELRWNRPSDGAPPMQGPWDNMLVSRGWAHGAGDRGSQYHP